MFRRRFKLNYKYNNECMFLQYLVHEHTLIFLYMPFPLLELTKREVMSSYKKMRERDKEREKERERQSDTQ